MSAFVRVGATALVLALGIFATFSSIAPVHAGDLAVITNADSGPGSLRQALQDASSNLEPDTITFAVTGTIVLDSPLEIVQDSVTVQGPGVDQLAISGSYLYRIFEIGAGAAVTITDLALTAGRAPNGEAGGAIRSYGQLAVLRVDLHNNLSASVGGAVSAESGSLRIESSFVHSNTARSNGGIYVGNAAGVISGTVLAMNQGSALAAYDASALQLNATQVTSNTGRGIDVKFTKLYLSNALVNANAGGGIAAQNGTVFLSDSAVTGNRSAEGAGIHMVWGSVIMTNTVLAENHAQRNGGAVYLSIGSQELTLARSTVQGNTAPNGAGIYMEGGDLQVRTSRILANVGAHGSAFYFYSLRDAVVTDSCIVNNWSTTEAGQAVELSEYNSYYVSAPNNWWGAPDGPGGAGPGEGDTVDERVIFVNFKTASPSGCLPRTAARLLLPILGR